MHLVDTLWRIGENAERVHQQGLQQMTETKRSTAEEVSPVVINVVISLDAIASNQQEEEELWE